MAKPTKQDVSNLDYSWLGQPFVRYAAKSTINTSDLDYSWLAQPFVTAAADVTIASSSFAVTASCSQNILAEAIQSQQEEENTIFKVYAQWRNIFSRYKSHY